MNPRAVRDITLDTRADGTAIATVGTASWQLSAAAAFVLANATGDTSVDTLLANAEHGAAVWDALDELADAQLLQERLSPPTGGPATHVVRAISRREAFGRAAAVAVAAAGVGLVLRSGAAHAQDTIDAADDVEKADPEIKEHEAGNRLQTEKQAKSRERLKQCRARMESETKAGRKADCAADEAELNRNIRAEQAHKNKLQARRQHHRERRRKLHQRESATKTSK